MKHKQQVDITQYGNSTAVPWGESETSTACRYETYETSIAGRQETNQNLSNMHTGTHMST